MNLETIACPLCSGERHSPWASENGLQAVKCEDCGLVFVNPRPSADTIEEANKLGMHRTDAGTLNVVYRPNWKLDRIYRRDVAESFADKIQAGKPLRWLDVGAGYGEFVSAVGLALPKDSEVVGIEPMTAKAEAAASAGIPIVDTPLAEVRGKFDVVSIMNVFSHIPDFRSFLLELREKLRQGGSLYMRTGNGGDLRSRQDYPDKLDLPDHLVFAGEKNLERYLAEADFAVVWRKADRLDTASWAIKSVVKKAMGRSSPVVLPYRSPFRDIRLRADLTGAV